MPRRPARAFQRMLSGRRLDLLDPTPADVEIEDIAHGLSFVARWNGQTRGDYAYSVAEHSLLVERLFTTAHPGVAARWSLAALLHDAPEYVIGDMISPVKAAIGGDYTAIDARITAAVHHRVGLPAEIPKPVKAAIKEADRVSARLEATAIAGFSTDEAMRFFPLRPKTQALYQSALDIGAEMIVLRPPKETRAAFTARYHALLFLMDRRDR